MIVQYLRDEGLAATATVLQDEAELHTADRDHAREELLQAKQAILDGQWAAAQQACAKLFDKQPVGARSFLYALHKQVYLEHLERREYQQAFNYLTKRIKTVESAIPTEEMRDLCYLLSCSSGAHQQIYQGEKKTKQKEETENAKEERKKKRKEKIGGKENDGDVRLI